MRSIFKIYNFCRTTFLELAINVVRKICKGSIVKSNQFLLPCPFNASDDSGASIYYNIAFVNSERWLAKSRVDITLCQHGKFPATLLLKFFVVYYKRNIKHFPCCYTVISTLVKIGKTRNCMKTLRPAGVFPISTRVDITVYQHGKCFIFLNCQLTPVCWNLSPLYCKKTDRQWPAWLKLAIIKKMAACRY